MNPVLKHSIPSLNINKTPYRVEIAALGLSLAYIPNLWSAAQADSYFEALKTHQWRQKQIRVYGQLHLEKRLTAFYGDAGVSYTYSGATEKAVPWSSILLEIKSRVESLEDIQYHGVLMNFYRHGLDYMGWHSDDEKSLTTPLIASVSFGTSRKFRFMSKSDPTQKLDLMLNHGDYLLMAGETQTHWKHALPKSKRVTEPRINLTFRTFL